MSTVFQILTDTVSQLGTALCTPPLRQYAVWVGFSRRVVSECNLDWFILNYGRGFQIATRKDIRERYRIRGTESSDFCAPFCCQWCDLVQGSRELQLEEESFDVLPHYGST